METSSFDDLTGAKYNKYLSFIKSALLYSLCSCNINEILQYVSIQYTKCIRDVYLVIHSKPALPTYSGGLPDVTLQLSPEN